LSAALKWKGCEDLDDGSIQALFGLNAAVGDDVADAQAAFAPYQEQCPWFNALVTSSDEMIKDNEDMLAHSGQEGTHTEGEGSLLERSESDASIVFETWAIVGIIGSAVTMLAGAGVILTACSEQAAVVKGQERNEGVEAEETPCFSYDNLAHAVYVVGGGLVTVSLTVALVFAKSQGLDIPVGTPYPTPAPTTPAPTISVEDIKKRAERENAQKGAVTITLTWNDKSDLDLHGYVTLANSSSPEQHIFYQNKKAAAGNLDVDMNANDASSSLEPVENIFWQTPKAGEYRITVDLYKKRGANHTYTPPVSFQALFQRESRDPVSMVGFVNIGPNATLNKETKTVEVFTFTVDAEGAVIKTFP